MEQIININQEAFAFNKRSAVCSQKFKADLSARLNRVEGQVRGIKGMIEREVCCDEVINQIFAARSALEAVSKLLVKNHIQGCVVEKIKNGDAEIVDELLVTISKML